MWQTKYASAESINLGLGQSYIYQVPQTIQMKLILLCVWAEPAVLGSAKTALKFIYKRGSLLGNEEPDIRGDSPIFEIEH